MIRILLALLLLSGAQRAVAADIIRPREGGGSAFPEIPASPRINLLPDAAVAVPIGSLPILAEIPGQAALQQPAAMAAAVVPAPDGPTAEASLTRPQAQASPLSELASLKPEERGSPSEPAAAPVFDGLRGAPEDDAAVSGRDLSSEYQEIRSALKKLRRPSGFAPRSRELAVLKQYKVLFVPGFLSGAFMKLSKATGKDPEPWHYFGSQERWLKRIGVEHEMVPVHTEQTVQHNSLIIEQAVKASRKPVIIISHSKGGLDTLRALERMETSVLEKVAGWIPVQSPFLGSPGADRVIDNPLVRYWISRFLEHSTVGGSRESLEGMTTQASERWYQGRRLSVARVLRAVPTVAFTSWKQIGFMNLLGELTHLGLQLNPFLNPWLFWSPLFGLALILKGVAGSLNWLAVKSDGLVPALRARLPEMDFVEEEGVDHFAPFIDHGGAFDRLEFTQALLQMVLKRVKPRAR